MLRGTLVHICDVSGAGVQGKKQCFVYLLGLVVN